MSAVAWHDVECGRYRADLPLWRELAAGAEGPVLDDRSRGSAGARQPASILEIGAGTGRVTLDLAGRGHAVVALDADAELLAALRARAGDLPVETVVADARDLDLGRTFALVLVPMQTLQLLGGPSGRAAFLRAAHRHLRPGGLLAAALADPLDGFEDDLALAPPPPDVGEVDGTLFASQVVAVRAGPEATTIERIRRTAGPDGAQTAEPDVIALDRVDAATVAREAAGLGFAARPPRSVPETDEHVGSEVVVLWRP